MGTQQPGNGFLGPAGVLSPRTGRGRSSPGSEKGGEAPCLGVCPQEVTLSWLKPVWTPDFLRSTKNEKDFDPVKPGVEKEDISIAAQGNEASFSSMRLMAQLLGESENVFLSTNKRKIF